MYIKGLANVQETLPWAAKERSLSVYGLGAGQYLPWQIKADGAAFVHEGAKEPNQAPWVFLSLMMTPPV